MNLITTMTPSPTSRRIAVVAAIVVAIAVVAAMALRARAGDDKPAAHDKAASAPPRAALTVTVTQPQPAALPLRINANGSIAAWQEASIGTEANGLRLAEVRVNVGDVVKRGQVLATFAPDTMQADVAQIRAAVAEAEATLAEASANAQRARSLQATGALSDAAINQYLTAERTAQARLEAQRASANMQQLRLKMTQVLAPDVGVISARSATVGPGFPPLRTPTTPGIPPTFSCTSMPSDRRCAATRADVRFSAYPSSGC